MVHVTAPNGCDAVSASLLVEVSPDETPTVSATGELEFCEGGSVILTSTAASEYTWSNQMTGQSITVSQPGSYSVTITGTCDNFTSTPITVSTLNAPAPNANDVVIPSAGTADLIATGVGSEFNWYDQAAGGSLVGAGANWTTPFVSGNTTYYVEEVHTYGGGITYGAKTNKANDGVYHNSTTYYNYFDVNEDCSLISVKVYTETAGNRTAYIEDSNGNTVFSQEFNMPAGESRIYFTGWNLTPGTDYRFRALEADHGMWRDDSPANVNFPYTVGDMVTITGANTGSQQYYYYYYDWEVEADGVECISSRTPVEVSIDPSVGIENIVLENSISAYPNPSNGVISVEFGLAISALVNITVADLTGKTIQHEVVSSVTEGQIHSLDLSILAKGTYMLTVNSAEGNWTQPIMIK